MSNKSRVYVLLSIAGSMLISSLAINQVLCNGVPEPSTDPSCGALGSCQDTNTCGGVFGERRAYCCIQLPFNTCKPYIAYWECCSSVWVQKCATYAVVAGTCSDSQDYGTCQEI